MNQSSLDIAATSADVAATGAEAAGGWGALGWGLVAIGAAVVVGGVVYAMRNRVRTVTYREVVTWLKENEDRKKEGSIACVLYNPVAGANNGRLFVGFYDTKSQKIVDGIEYSKCILDDELKELAGSGKLIIINI